jgi:translation initiation factor 2 beta subunit (eIF-2beta)/eIF-5
MKAISNDRIRDHDEFYRYKRDIIHLQSIKKFGKDYLSFNLDKIGKQIRVRPDKLLKHIKKELSVSILLNKDTNMYECAGNSNLYFVKIEKAIDKYIKLYVLCGKCGLPELCKSEKGKVCRACGMTFGKPSAVPVKKTKKGDQDDEEPEYHPPAELSQYVFHYREDGSNDYPTLLKNLESVIPKYRNNPEDLSYIYEWIDCYKLHICYINKASDEERKKIWDRDHSIDAILGEALTEPTMKSEPVMVTLKTAITVEPKIYSEPVNYIENEFPKMKIE